MRIFVGSPSEAAREVDEIATCLRAEGAEVLPWTDHRAFPKGRTYIESLESALRGCDSALIIARADDEVLTRGDTDLQPRDNVILEYGMSITAFGRERVALAVMGRPRLPTDVLGVKPLMLPDSTDLAAFRQALRVPIREWVEQLQRTPQQFALQTDLPNFYKRLVAILSRGGTTDPRWRQQIDEIASDLIEWAAESFEGYSMGDLAESMQANQLRECNGLFAVDVLGPQAWVTPGAYRYLARQIRHYLRKNAGGPEPRLVVSDQLKGAIDRAVKNATAKHHLPQSYTLFDNPDELRVEVGEPAMEYARLLLWTKDELKSRIADTVITIHDQLSVPLFFIETKPDSELRNLDFLAVRHKDGRVSGKINRRQQSGAPYRLEELERGMVPGLVPGKGFALPGYWELLQNEDVLFAKDALRILAF